MPNAEYMRAYRETNRERLRHQDWVGCLRRLYGLTPEDYYSILAKQGGVCKLCGNPPTKRKLAVDHCHETGRVRGLLCTACNTSLGQLGDTPESIRRVLDYLTEEADAQ